MNDTSTSPSKTAPLRVMQIIGHMGSGGVEATVLNHYRAIDHSRIQFDFVVNKGSNRVPYEEITALGGRVREVPGYSKLPAYLTAVSRLCRELEPSIVHSHVNALSVFPLSSARIQKVPVRIAHSHSTSAPAEPLRNVLKFALRSASRTMPTDLAACSNHAAEWLFGTKAVAERRVHIIRNALALQSFQFNSATRAAKRRDLGLDDQAIVIGCVGRLRHQKNQPFLLDAFAEVIRMEPSAILLLVGEGELQESLQSQAARLGIADSVKFLGSHAAVGPFYAAMDVLAFPSIYEGLGMVAVEAQAASLPVVVSERVPDEAIILEDLVTRVALDEGAAIWAQTMLNVARSARPPAADVLPRLERAGYAIQQSARELENWYLELAARATKQAHS